MKRILLLAFILIAGMAKNDAQSKHKLTGKLYDQSGQLILNATIKAVKSGTSSLSEKDGFSINLSTLPDTLIVSHIGYETTKFAVLNTTKTLTLSLKQENNELDDITINTGYQKVKPNEVNGSYVVIDNKTLNQQTGTNILDRLNGVTSSLAFTTGTDNQNNPQNKTNITIRGLSTINGPLDPLIVVDNFIYEGDIANINPNDVESVTILKDAAAASIWGARAGNGVIVITTKKGKFNQKFKLDFNANMIVANKPDLYSVSKLSSIDYIDIEQMQFNNGYFDSDIGYATHPALSGAVEVFLARRNGEISSQDSANQINALKKVDNREDFTKYYYRKGLTKQYALSLSGGSESLAWLIAGNYNHSISNLHAEADKINLRIENTYRPIKNLNINLSVYYTNSKSSGGMQDYEQTASINGNTFVPYMRLAGPNGESIPIPHKYRPSFLDTLGGGRLLNMDYYPMEDWKHDQLHLNIDDIVSQIGVNYKIIKGLDLNVQYQYDRQIASTQRLSDTSSYIIRENFNSFTQIDRATGNINYIMPVGGKYYIENTSTYAQNFRSQLNFDRTFKQIHHISILAGMEVRETNNATDGSVTYGYQENPLRKVSVDAANPYPDLFTGGKVWFQGNPVLRKTYYRFVSYFTNGSYILKNKYILSASGRKDGSNIFGANTNDKWKPLWSAGLGWNLSNENFYKISWLPTLRLNATYGVSGNVDMTKTSLPIASSGNDSYTQLPTLYLNSLNNPDLRWEMAYQSNFRLAFATRRQIMSGSIEYYHKKGTDLYGDAPFDYTAGGGREYIRKNIAEMVGNGWDITLHSINIHKKLNWTTNFLLSIAHDKTTKYFLESDYTFPELALLRIQGNQINPVVGKPLYALSGYKWGGLNKEGDPQGYIGNELSTDYKAIIDNGDNNGIGGGSIVYIGPTQPTVFGALMNTFSWKGISLSFNFTYKLNYYFKYDIGSGANFSDRWQKPGDELNTDIPKSIYPTDGYRSQLYKYANINIHKGDHIRLQFINFAYDFRKLSHKRLFNSLQVYFNATNIGILWKANKVHVDPDYINNIAPPKTYTFGIRANF